MSRTHLPERQGLMATLQTHTNHDIPKESSSTLKNSAPSWLWRVGMPAILIAIPLTYIAMIGSVVYLHNKRQNTFGDSVLEALQIASTLWPISFAAVMGPFLKTLALHRAEKGSALGSLEFLLTSQTTAAAFKNLVKLGSFQFWALSIALVWCLSPLGGQAAVRSLHLKQDIRSIETSAIHYLGSNMSDLNLFYGGGDAGIFSGASTYQTLLLEMKTVVAAGFSTPDILVSHVNGSTDNFDAVVASLGGVRQAARLAQRDLWRNVRIPFMELLPGYDTRDPTAWLSVPSDRIVPYASLIGIPIRGGSFDRIGNSTMVVQSHYQTLACGADFNGAALLESDSKPFFFHRTNSTTSIFNQLPTGASSANPNKPNMFLDVANNSTTRMHFNWTYPSFEPSSKLEFIVGENCPPGTAMLRTCNISTSYVDIEVACTRSSSIDELVCQAQRVRHTSKFPFGGNLTALSQYMAMPGILWDMPFTTASYHVAEPSYLELYLKQPTRLLSRLAYARETGDSSCFRNVSQDVFQERLATALNTFIMASYNASVITGGDGTTLDGRNLMWKNTTATWTEFADSIYVLDRAWFSISLLSTLVLFSCSVVNVVIRSLIKAPDFLDSVAGLTRDSPYIDVPQKGSGMSGSDRLQMIKDVRVRICDVEPESESGRVALTTGVDNRKLDWGRRYC